MLKNYSDPLALPRTEAYKEAIDELMDVPGLSKIRPIMDKYKLSFVGIDFRLKITVRIPQGLNLPKERHYLIRDAIDDIMDIRGLNQVRPIMEKYNVSYFLIDKDFNFSAKRSKNYCPQRHSAVQ